MTQLRVTQLATHAPPPKQQFVFGLSQARRIFLKELSPDDEVVVGVAQVLPP